MLLKPRPCESEQGDPDFPELDFSDLNGRRIFADVLPKRSRGELGWTARGRAASGLGVGGTLVF